jgi:hypothetical protein
MTDGRKVRQIHRQTDRQTDQGGLSADDLVKKACLLFYTKRKTNVFSVLKAADLY